MREPVLDILKCARCGGGQFDLRAEKKDDSEIRGAEILCKKCGAKYAARDGILFIGDEAKIPDNIKNPAQEGDSFILSLPDVKDSVFDITSKTALEWSKQGENFSAVLEKIEPLQNKLVLDMGAGCCWTTAEFARRGANCVAYDNITEKYYGLSSADIFLHHQGIYFERVCGNFEKLPFADNSFDIIFNDATFGGLKNIPAIIKEIARVTKPCGVLALSNEGVRTIFRGNKKYLSFGQWMKSIKKAGFKGRAIFPASATSVLERWRKRLKIKRTKKVGIDLLAGFWKLPGVKPAAESILIIPAHALFGMDFNYIGRKEIIASRCRGNRVSE